MFKLNTFFSRIMSIEPIRRQSIVSLFWQIAFILIGFFSTMYFVRAVGASVFGAYFLFLAYYSVISLFTDSGFGGVAVKCISEGEEPDAYFSAFVVLRSMFVIVVIIVLITLRLEATSLLNILKASIVMGGLVVGMYRLIVPFSSVWLALVPVVVGGIVYWVLVLKFDKKIYEELKGIMMQMNVGCPKCM